MLAVHMVMIMGILLQKVRVDVQLGIQIETLEVEHLRQGHLAKVHHLLRRTRVHVFQAVLQGVEFFGRDQIGLADENLVGKADLAAGLLAVVQLLSRVLGVHQGQDGVQQISFGDLVVHEKSLRHRAGVGQTRGLDHDAVKVQQALAALGGQQLQGHAQVFADGAADAAVAHLDDLLVGVAHQDVAVDVFLTNLYLIVNFGFFLFYLLFLFILLQLVLHLVLFFSKLSEVEVAAESSLLIVFVEFFELRKFNFVIIYEGEFVLLNLL